MMWREYKGRGMVYALVLFFITLSGFAQMPIFARYHISDVPGLGWLADFYVTHVIHYLMAAVFMGFGLYVVLDFLFIRRGLSHMTRSGWVKTVSLAGLVVTGCVMVYKNMAGVYFPHGLIIGLDLLHLGCCMVLLGASAYTAIRKVAWVKADG